MKTFKLYKNLLAFSMLFILLVQISFAQSFQDLKQIRLGAKNFLETQTTHIKHEKQILISSIDKRLKLSKCTTPINYEIYGKGNLNGRITLKASCQSQNWFLYLAAQIKTYQKVIVAKQSIPRNTYLMPKHLQLIEKDTGRLSTGFYFNIENLIGSKITRNIRAGEVITPYMVKLKQLVNKGDKISIISKNSVIEVKMPGIAMQSGNLGQQIMVKNAKSGKELKSVVIGKYKVSVDF